jgi:RNA polymerase sigma factor (sigma-70 family)
VSYKCHDPDTGVPEALIAIRMPASRSEFERLILPHLAVAYSLARWLLRHPQNAEDAVQEAVLKAYKAFDGYAGGNAKAWLLAIVRNTCLTAIERQRAEGRVVILQDVAQERDLQRAASFADPAPLADARLIAEEERRRVHRAIAALPAQFREVIVLREFHDLDYRAIADVVGAPIGTVMSRLARARERLKDGLASQNESAGTETGKTK